MKQFLILSVFLFSGIICTAQKSLSDYTYLIVPEQFEFLKGNDQYQLNSMTKFYFEKNGFNAFMSLDAPNTDRCNGLYADVEELKSLFGTKLQIVLKDCYKQEVYRSEIGKSKYKEFDKSYQDALRSAFESLEVLNIKQDKELILLSNLSQTKVISELPTKNKDENNTNNKEKVLSTVNNTVEANTTSETMIPVSKYSNYILDGKSFLLRKTEQGYSLYEESAKEQDGLLLKGKVVVIDEVIKYMDSTGKVYGASFDALQNLTISTSDTKITYLSNN